METPNPKCPRCKCYWKPDETDIRTSGLFAKTCKKCRTNQQKYKTELKKEDIEINTDNKKTNKCIICKELWVRADTEKVWESIECLTCYKCRANGGNPDNIDISQEIYPEPVKNKIPVWTPDSSESD